MRKTAAAVAVAGLALALTACSDEPRPTVGTGELGTSSLGPIGHVQSAPAARFTRTTYTSGRLAQAATMLDRCGGPVAIDLGPDRAVLVAEHDYCGGSAWISRLRPGDAVKLAGVGVTPGTYVVTDLTTEHRGEARVRDLPAADVVLQTCTAPGEVVLVATNRFVPSVQS